MLSATELEINFNNYMKSQSYKEHKIELLNIDQNRLINKWIHNSILKSKLAFSHKSKYRDCSQDSVKVVGEKVGRCSEDKVLVDDQHSFNLFGRNSRN
mmetsp:Transcript_13465/g.11961  ORF Transcript_13465/g.11961 Transcript_13465/m.11961 type:complete len:98 (-) Transcript_13465:34-327(-)